MKALLVRTEDEHRLQGFVTWTTFTTWQNHFRWDSLTPTADIERDKPERKIDADGSIAKALSGEVFEGDVAANTNLVVSAGIRKFPFPNLAYKCGMGKCSTCTCRILAGADHLEPPNWKEKRQLGERLDEGYRLACQLWVTEDIELAQDV